MDLFTRLFDTSDFPKCWDCGSWTPGLGWLHILSDLGVWSAYLAIPCILVYFVLRKKDMPFRAIFWLFGAFILACGTTHLMEAIIFWWPAYRLAGLIKLFTAIVSWTTVIALVPLVPRALAMRSPEELEQEIAERMRAEEALRQYTERLQVLSRRVVEVQEEERRHLARELHDEIGQALTAIGINLEVIGRPCSPEDRPRIEDCLGIVHQATDQVHCLALDLRPSILDDLGLAAALRWLVDRQAQRAGFVGHFIDQLPGNAMHPDLATACFRVVQEALTNVVRHARARQVWVELQQGDAEVRLIIRDDGVGFDPGIARQRLCSGCEPRLAGDPGACRAARRPARHRVRAGTWYHRPRLAPCDIHAALGGPRRRGWGVTTPNPAQVGQIGFSETDRYWRRDAGRAPGRASLRWQEAAILPAGGITDRCA